MTRCWPRTQSVALELAGNKLHYRVAGLVSGAGARDFCHDGTRGFVQPILFAAEVCGDSDRERNFADKSVFAPVKANLPL
jgi:hypothetical protein